MRKRCRAPCCVFWRMQLLTATYFHVDQYRVIWRVEFHYNATALRFLFPPGNSYTALASRLHAPPPAAVYHRAARVWRSSAINITRSRIVSHPLLPNIAVIIRYSSGLRTLVSQLLRKGPRSRPTTGAVLRLPLIKEKIGRFLNEAQVFYTRWWYCSLVNWRPYINFNERFVGYLWKLLWLCFRRYFSSFHRNLPFNRVRRAIVSNAGPSSPR